MGLTPVLAEGLATGLASLPTWALAGLAVVAAAFVLSLLHILTCAARNEMQIHMLRVDTHRLRNAYVRRLSGQDDEGEFDIVEPEPVEVAEAADAEASAAQVAQAA